MGPPFLSSGTPLSARLLIGGFASQPRDWFAFIGKEPSMPDKISNRCASRSSAQYFCTIGYNSTIFNRLLPYATVEHTGWKAGPVWEDKTLQPDVNNSVTQVTIVVCATFLEGGVPANRDTAFLF